MLWPSSAMLTRHDGAGLSLYRGISFVYGTALLENMAFYAIIGLITWPAVRRLCKREKRPLTE